MTHSTDLTLTWTPLVGGLVELLAQATPLEARDGAATELRKLLAAAGATPAESERLLVALAARPHDPALRERLYAAARRVDDRAAAGVVR